MTHEELSQAAARQPFQPFRLILTTGATHDIRHPELIMVGRRSAIISLASKPEATVYDHTLRVDLLRVVGIEEIPATPPSQNGPPTQQN